MSILCSFSGDQIRIENFSFNQDNNFNLLNENSFESISNETCAQVKGLSIQNCNIKEIPVKLF